MNPLRGGDYCQLATLYDVPGKQRDAYGQPSSTGVAVGTFMVSIRPMAGTEGARERQVWPTATHVIRLPYTWDAIPPASPHNPDGRIVPSMKFGVQKDRDAAPRWFNVVAALDVEELGIEWRCICQEVSGASV